MVLNNTDDDYIYYGFIILCFCVDMLQHCVCGCAVGCCLMCLWIILLIVVICILFLFVSLCISFVSLFMYFVRYVTSLFFCVLLFVCLLFVCIMFMYFGVFVWCLSLCFCEVFVGCSMFLNNNNDDDVDIHLFSLFFLCVDHCCFVYVVLCIVWCFFNNNNGDVYIQ